MKSQSCLAVFATVLALGAECVAAPLSLRVSKKQMHSEGGSGLRSSSRSSAIRKWTTYEYHVSANVSRGETMNVDVEAHFISRGGSGQGAREYVSKSQHLAKRTFGGGNPMSYRAVFDSPVIFEELTRTRTYYGSSSSRSQGEQHLGVLVRVLSGDEVLKVASIPYNRAWEEAGAERIFTLDPQHRPQRASNHPAAAPAAAARPGRDPNQLEYRRKEGTDETTPAGWHDDYWAALERSRQSGKLVLLTFGSGSSSNPYPALRYVLFQEYARKFYELVYVCANCRDEKHREQASEVRNIFDMNRYLPSPHMIIVSPSGRKIFEFDCPPLSEARTATDFRNWFEGAEKCQRLYTSALDETVRKGFNPGSQEYALTMHGAFSQMEEGVVMKQFKATVQDIVRQYPELAKSYPYIELVEPLETKFEILNNRLSGDVREAMAGAGLNPDGYSSDYRRYKRRVFMEGNYQAQYDALQADINKALSRLAKYPYSAERCRDLRKKIMRAINSF